MHLPMKIMNREPRRNGLRKLFSKGSSLFILFRIRVVNSTVKELIYIRDLFDDSLSVINASMLLDYTF